MSWRCLPALQYNGIIRLVVLREPKKQYICEVKQQCLFYDPLTQDNPQTLSHVGTVLFLTNYTCRQYHCKKGSVDLLVDKRLELMTRSRPRL